MKARKHNVTTEFNQTINENFDVSLDLPPSSTAVAPARVASCPPAERVGSGYRHKGAAPRDSELKGASHLPSVSGKTKRLTWATVAPSWLAAGHTCVPDQILNAEGVVNIRRELVARSPDDPTARHRLNEATLRLAVLKREVTLHA